MPDDLIDLGHHLPVLSMPWSIDRILPFAAIPRILRGGEWAVLEAGVNLACRVAQPFSP